MATVTANMGLSIPAVNDSDYPTSITDSLNAIDDHDHSSGSGVQIPTGGIAASAVTTPKIADGNVTEAKIATNAVTVTKIADGSVQTAKIADLNVTAGKLANSAVENAKIATSAVSNAKILDGAVSQNKMAPLNFNQGGSSGSFSTASTSYVDVISTTLTPQSRVVMIVPEHDGGAGQAQIAVEGASAATCQVVIRFLRDSTVIGEYIFNAGVIAGGLAVSFAWPSTSVWVTDRVPGTLPVTYKMQMRIAGAATVGYVISTRLAAIEIF